MEAERRADIRADFQQRQAHTDRLMQMSGQPVRRLGGEGDVGEAVWPKDEPKTCVDAQLFAWCTSALPWG